VKRTQQKISEQARVLESLNARLNGIIHSMMDAVITIDSQQRIVLFNPAAEAMFGITAIEVEGAHIERLIPNHFWFSHGRFVDAFGLTGLTNRSMGALGAINGLRTSGDEFPIEASISQVEIDGEKLFTVIVRDITERKKAEEQQARLAAIVNNSEDAIIGETSDGSVTTWNPGAEALFGYSATEMIGCSVRRIIPPDCLSQEEQSLIRLRVGQAVHRETVRLKKSGERVPVSITWSPVKDSRGNIIAAATIARDITEQKAAEEKLRDAQRKLLLYASDLERRVEERTRHLHEAEQTSRRLSSELLRIQDEEHRRIARELHDSIGQSLAALSMMLHSVNRLLPNTHAAEKALRGADSMLKQAIQEVRNISFLLHPPMLEDLGLSSAIQSYVEGFAERSGIKIKLEIPANVRLPEFMAISVYRVVQESLTNILRHSGANCAEVTLETSDKMAVLKVRDYGKGIPADKLQNLKIGLETGVGFGGMRARIRELHGEFEVESGESGTTVKIIVPLTVASPKSVTQAVSPKSGQAQAV
jgi:PAS domain S-box-containing protein